METTIPSAAPPVFEDRVRPGWLTSTATAVGVLLLGAGFGAGGGWLWYEWWGPPDQGRVYQVPGGPTWYPSPFDPGTAHVFTGTAQYVVVGAVLGLLLGVAAGLLGRRRTLVALGALAVASVGASLLASRVGFALSPPDPQSLVDQVDVGTRLPAAIELSGWSPYLVWPAAALFGFSATLLGVTALEDVRRREGDPSLWMERRTSH